MRRLPKEVAHSPKIFGLKFSHFFIFGIVAALERLLIKNEVIAFLGIISTYGTFIAFQRFVPPRLFYYFITKVNHFELEQNDEGKSR